MTCEDHAGPSYAQTRTPKAFVCRGKSRAANARSPWGGSARRNCGLTLRPSTSSRTVPSAASAGPSGIALPQHWNSLTSRAAALEHSAMPGTAGTEHWKPSAEVSAAFPAGPQRGKPWTASIAGTQQWKLPWRCSGTTILPPFPRVALTQHGEPDGSTPPRPSN